jgi:hypothetical protein
MLYYVTTINFNINKSGRVGMYIDKVFLGISGMALGEDEKWLGVMKGTSAKSWVF